MQVKAAMADDIKEPADRKLRCLGMLAPEVKHEEMTASSMKVILLASLATGAHCAWEKSHNNAGQHSLLISRLCEPSSEK